MVVLCTARHVPVAVPVTPGVKTGELTAVTGDLKSGDRAVLRPDDKLTSGALVKVAAKG